MKSKINRENLLLILFTVSVFILSIIRIEDTDTWMHLSLGRLIWGLKGFPATEQFVYTDFGKPFSYSSWLFGLLYYLSYLGLNITGVVLLKAVVIAGAFLVLIRDSLRPYRNYVLSIVVMVLVVIVARHRFAERPETFMMVFLSFSIFSLNAYLYDNKKYIYALPVVHMLWANCHSSINLMVVPFLAFIAGGMVHRYLSRKDMAVDHVPSPSQIKTVVFVFVASFAASLISPYFINQYLFGTQFLSTPWFKQEIVELQRPEWRITKWLYLASAVLLITFVLTVKAKRVSVIHFLMVIPFVALSFTAKRFVFLYAVIAGPVMVRNLAAFLDAKSWGSLMNKKGMAVAASVWIIFFTSFALIKGTPFDGGRKKFGIGTEYSYVPEYALRYLDKNGIRGRIFNTFEWGGYIIWRDFPGRTVFVDPRGYISVDLLEKMGLAQDRPFMMDALEQQYGFDAILIKFPLVHSGIANLRWGLVHPRWALVYWDDVSLLYLKRGGRYDPVVQRDEYRFLNPADGLPGLRSSLQDVYTRAHMIDELQRNVRETGSSKAYLYLGFVYNETGRYQEAIDVFSKVRDLPSEHYLPQAYSGIAYAFEQLGKIQDAIKYYKLVLSAKNEAPILYEIGRLYLKERDRENALRYLKKAFDKDNTYSSVYPLLIGIYQELGKTKELAEIKKLYEEAQIKNQTNEHFKKGIDAYFGGRFDAALAEFRKAIELNPGDAASYSNIGYIYYDMGDLANAYAYQQKALGIDPDLANAHYGLAMIYKTRRDFRSEKKHLEEYLRAEPSGYYSRRAKEEIERIDAFFSRQRQ